MGGQDNQGISQVNCTLSVIKFSYLYDGNWAPIVYVQGGDGINLAGFHLWIQKQAGGGGGGGGAVV